MNLSFPHTETWMHRVNPSLKLIVTLILLLAVLFIHNINWMINITVCTFLILAVCTGHPWKRLLLYVSPFILIFISSTNSMMLFGKGETIWFEWGIVHITRESFFRGIHLGFRALDLAAVGMILALTTKPVHMFYSLMQQCRLAPKYAYSFMAAIRLIPTIAEELQIRRYALKVRGIGQRRGLRKLIFLIRQYSIPMLAQSIRRAQRTAVAMEAKRFSVTKERTYYYRIGFSSADAGFICLWLAVYAAAYALSAYVPYVNITDVR